MLRCCSVLDSSDSNSVTNQLQRFNSSLCWWKWMVFFSPFILSSCTLAFQTSTLLSLVFVSSMHAPHHSTPLKFSYLCSQTRVDKWHTDFAGMNEKLQIKVNVSTPCCGGGGVAPLAVQPFKILRLLSLALILLAHLPLQTMGLKSVCQCEGWT